MRSLINSDNVLRDRPRIIPFNTQHILGQYMLILFKKNKKPNKIFPNNVQLKEDDLLGFVTNGINESVYFERIFIPLCGVKET